MVRGRKDKQYIETIYQQIREKRTQYKNNKQIIEELNLPVRTFYDYLHRMAEEDKEDIIQMQSASHKASILKRMQESTIKAIHVLQEIMDDQISQQRPRYKLYMHILNLSMI